MSYGPIYQEQERKRKLQEYNELDKIKKEEEEKKAKDGIIQTDSQPGGNATEDINTP